MTKLRELFRFEPLARFLDSRGFPQVDDSGFKVIRRDFSMEEREGRIRYEWDAVILVSDETQYKGYIYLKHPVHIEQYGPPKFHIGVCEKIAKEKAAGKFENRYFWSNSPKVDLIDAVTGREYKQVELEICTICKRKTWVGFNSTLGFTELLDRHDQKKVPDEVVLDLFGYTTDWQKISRAIREERNHTCQCCGLQVPPNQRRRGMLQVHHLSGDKSDNRRANLLCLCVYCHARMDEHHESNFKATSRMRKQLQSFLKLDGNEALKREHSLCRHETKTK